jgi:O-antigen/teichoic acid export membrane protein
MNAAIAQPSSKSLLRDGAYTLTGRILRTVLALALGVLVARALGPYERGLYALPTAVYTGLILSVFTGISLAVSYFMLTAGAGREILRPALWTCAIFSALGSVPAAAAAVLGHNAWAAAPSVLILPCSAATMVLLGYAVGSKQIRWQTSYSVLSTAALLAGIGAALALFGATAATAVTAFVLVNIAVGAACLWVVFRDARTRRGSAVRLRDFMLYALRVGVVNLVTLLNYRADLYVVALLSTTAILGQYAVAVSAAEGLLVVTQVGAIVTSPHVGAMGQKDAAVMTAACVRASLVIAVPICAAFYILAPLVVHLLYGAAYLPLVPALRILLVAVLVLSMGSPISNFFTLNRGKPEVALASAFAAAAVCLTLSWLLVPRIGMQGAALATAVAYLFGECMRLGFFISATRVSIATILFPTRRDAESCVTLVKSATRDMLRSISSRKSPAREQ